MFCSVANSIGVGKYIGCDQKTKAKDKAPEPVAEAAPAANNYRQKVEYKFNDTSYVTAVMEMKPGKMATEFVRKRFSDDGIEYGVDLTLDTESKEITENDNGVLRTYRPEEEAYLPVSNSMISFAQIVVAYSDEKSHDQAFLAYTTLYALVAVFNFDKMISETK